MTDTCTLLSDRMPAVAAGDARWSAEDSAHLARCADCAAEWDLVRRAGLLGVRETLHLDVTQLGTDALARVRIAGRVRSVRRHATAVLGLAAAAALAIAMWTARTSETMPLPQETAFVLPLIELEALEAEELELVLDGLAAPLAEGTSLETPTLDDLDSTELERVLRAWEG